MSRSSGRDRAVAAIVVAAGEGRRFGAEAPKQYASLAGEPLLVRTLRAFLAHPAVSHTVVVVRASDVEVPPAWLGATGATRVAGGAERGDSVRAGLEAIGKAAIVLVHDGARPLVSAGLIDRVLAGVAPGIGAVPALPLPDTVKEVDGGGVVVRTLDRGRLRRIQTPQGFPADELRHAYLRASESGFEGTDDAAVFQQAGGRVVTVPGQEVNLKITDRGDLDLAELLLTHSLSGEARP